VTKTEKLKSLRSWAESYSRGAAGCSILVGVIVLLGWGWDIPALKSILPGLATMKANTALCFVLTGMSLMLLVRGERVKKSSPLRRRATIGLASLVLAITFLTMMQYALGWDLKIDQLLFRDTVPDLLSLPGRISPLTALSFLALSVSLLLLSGKSERQWVLGQQLALLPTIVSGGAMLGYVYSVASFYQVVSYTGMAIHTALTLLIVSFAMTLQRTDCGIAKFLTSVNLGGVVVRSLIPVSIFVPVTLGWLQMEGQKGGFYSPQIGLALGVTLNIAVLSAVIYQIGKHVQSTAIAQQEAEDSLQISFQRLEALHAIDRAILTAKSSQEIAEAALERIMNFISCDRASVVLFDMEHGTAGYLAIRERSGAIPIKEAGLSISDFTSPELLGQEPFHYIPDLQLVPDRTRIQNHLLETGNRSVLNFHLVAVGKIIGQLRLKATRPDAFTQEDAEIASETAGQLAVAIHHSQLSENFRQLGETLESVINACPLPILMLDDRATIQIWNQAAERVFGWSREEVIGRGNPLIHKEIRKECEALVENLRRGESIYGMETVRITKENKTVPVVLWAAPHKTRTGEVSGWVVILEDARDRRNLEAQLRQAQKMEAIGQLAGGVAHDFNNLLGVIIGYSDLQIESLRVEDPLRKGAEEIRRSAERAGNLTRQLLAFSRKQVLRPSVLDLNVIIEDLGTMLRRLIGEDIEFKISLDPSLGKIKADPTQIEQVLVNLVVNARDAMPDGGTLMVETSNEELDDEYARKHADAQPGLYSLITIRDTGVGMDRNVQARLFEPFFTTKEKGKGTGLGLATVFGIVKQSGGLIWVYSEPGKGSSFKIYLPQSDGLMREAQRKSPEEAPLGGNETILLVEDETSLRELGSFILRGCGYTVLEATCVKDALEISECHPGIIDLLLTDVVLPGGSGHTVADTIKQRRTTIKVIYASGYPDEAIAQHGVLSEGLAFLQKPFTKDALKRKIREVLGENGAA